MPAGANVRSSARWRAGRAEILWALESRRGGLPDHDVRSRCERGLGSTRSASTRAPPLSPKLPNVTTSRFALAFRFARIRIILTWPRFSLATSVNPRNTTVGFLPLPMRSEPRAMRMGSRSCSIITSSKRSPAAPTRAGKSGAKIKSPSPTFILVVASPKYHSGYNLQHAAGTAPGIIPEILIIRKRIRAEGYQPNTVRPVVLDPADVPYVPDAISHLQRFRGGDVENVLAWITGSSAAGAPAGAWPSASTND
jgi:hypothetical protein